MAYAGKISFDKIEWEKGDVGKGAMSVPGKGVFPVIQNRFNNKLYYCIDIPKEFIESDKFKKLRNIALY